MSQYMPSRIVDEEAGQAGLKECAVRVAGNSLPTTPTTPQSTTTTFVDSSAGRQSTCSDDRSDAPEATRHQSGVWSRRTRSILASLGMRRKSSPCATGVEDEAAKKRARKEQDRKAEEKVRESIVRVIPDQPNGYPRLATFLDSDENFMIYRRFGYLQTRLVLERQDELRQLEMDLERLERSEARTSPEDLQTREDMSDDKAELLETIEKKWNSYCVLINNASTMTAMNKPTTAEQYSVARWMWRNVQPLSSPEMKFIQCKEDLVTLRPGREHAWLDSSVEKMLQWSRCDTIRDAFRSRDTRSKSDGRDGTFLFTRTRIENFVVFIITFMILALLVVPIYLLYRYSDAAADADHGRQSFECIGVLLVSTLAFSACISLFTRAKRHEILGASAAYCAVLVVFIGNIGQRS